MRALHILALSAVTAAAVALPTLADTVAAPATITVTGEASVEAVPDMATLSIGVTTVADTASAALAANTASLQAVMDRLKAAGVEDRDLQTANFAVNPNWTGYDSSVSSPQISGYTAMNTLNVRIRDISKLGGVLDAAVTDGANTINGLTFALSDPRPALDDARKAAVADARAKAELLVAAAGAGLGRIVTISEGGGYSAPAPMFKADLASAPVPVAQGEVAMTASVTVVYEISQ